MLGRDGRNLLLNDSLLLHSLCIKIVNRDAEGIRRSSGDVAVALSTLREVQKRLLLLRDSE